MCSFSNKVDKKVGQEIRDMADTIKKGQCKPTTIIVLQ